MGKWSTYYLSLELSDQEARYLLVVDQSKYHDVQTMSTFETFGDWYMSHLEKNRKAVDTLIEQELKQEADASYTSAKFHFYVAALSLSASYVFFPGGRRVAVLAADNPEFFIRWLGNAGLWIAGTLGAGAALIDRNNIDAPVDIGDRLTYPAFKIIGLLSMITAGAKYIFSSPSLLQNLYARYYKDYDSNRWCLPALYGDGSIPIPPSR